MKQKIIFEDLFKKKKNDKIYKFNLFKDKKE